MLNFESIELFILKQCSGLVETRLYFITEAGLELFNLSLLSEEVPSGHYHTQLPCPFLF